MLFPPQDEGTSEAAVTANDQTPSVVVSPLVTESEVSLPVSKPGDGYDNAALVTTPGTEKAPPKPPGHDEDYDVIEREDVEDVEEIEGKGLLHVPGAITLES